MSNTISGVSAATQQYADYSSVTSKQAEKKATETTSANNGVVYEKSEPASTNKATYSINKMSDADRAALVKQLKADQASREQQITSLVHKMMSGQAKTYGQATDMWKFLASGDYTVDAATKAQAQKDISEDGYWGVKQTSQRLFDFACALAGDDVDKMKEMQAAVEKDSSRQPELGDENYRVSVKIPSMQQISYLMIIMLQKRSRQNNRLQKKTL